MRDSGRKGHARVEAHAAGSEVRALLQLQQPHLARARPPAPRGSPGEVGLRMADQEDALFGDAAWRLALEKYGAVTGLTVVVYGLDAHVVSGPIHPTPP